MRAFVLLAAIGMLASATSATEPHPPLPAGTITRIAFGSDDINIGYTLAASLVETYRK